MKTSAIEDCDIKVVGKLLRCECGGEMLPNGENHWTANPVKIGHECNACGTKEFRPDKYPTVVFERSN